MAIAVIKMPELGDPCACCHERPSEVWWVADGGALALSHGFGAPWCRLCVARAQLDAARASAGNALRRVT